jgi:hypothetical protein
LRRNVYFLERTANTGTGEVRRNLRRVATQDEPPDSTAGRACRSSVDRQWDDIAGPERRIDAPKRTKHSKSMLRARGGN